MADVDYGSHGQEGVAGGYDTGYAEAMGNAGNAATEDMIKTAYASVGNMAAEARESAGNMAADAAASVASASGPLGERLSRVSIGESESFLDWVLQKEADWIDRLGWDQWAVRTLVTLTILTVTTLILQSLPAMYEKFSEKMNSSGSYGKNKKDGKKQESKIPPGFRWFQMQYLAVYLTIMLADWLQGTNMYTLYDGYGVDIGSLFLTGFSSSAVFGTFLGIYVDKWGRRLGCIIFCVMEVIINILEHFNNFPLLIFGRIMGGMTTSLLFSAFETWMVSEHKKRFPQSKYSNSEALLESTFVIATAGNGIVAILGGIIAQVAADVSGDIGPFQLAIALTIITLVMILFWSENTGADDLKMAMRKQQEQSPTKKGKSNQEESMLSPSGFGNAMRTICRDPAMMCLGMSQAFFEGAVYTFVFMWVPNMQLVAGTKNIPYGLIFSCFMLSMTFGGIVAGALSEFLSPGVICLFSYALAASAMAVPIVSYEFWPVFIAFLTLEGVLGMFQSTAGALRSLYFPTEQQASLMSVFRIPLNAIVVCGTKLTSYAGTDVASLQKVFGVVVCIHGSAFLFQLYLRLACAHKGGMDGSEKVVSPIKKASASKLTNFSRGKSPRSKKKN